MSVLGNLESSYQNPNARDPQATRTDAELISVLRRAWLLPQEGVPIDPATEAKFSLDASVNDEGRDTMMFLSYFWLIFDPSQVRTTALEKSSFSRYVGLL